MSSTIKIFNNSNKKYIARKKIQDILKKILEDANITNASINLIFTDNDSIHDLNYRYLNHDYATDVLSFCLEEDPLEGEIYVCVSVALENATEYQTTCKNELARYSIHGLLHLLGYDDKTDEEKKIMHEKEDFYLNYMKELENNDRKNS
ncbi:MAG: rRNA maturation RNase YbeY [Bacteroidetes bacterium]|nr:rRNA maturation RNase YbeY [Bacteroidota bacterium]